MTSSNCTLVACTASTESMCNKIEKGVSLRVLFRDIGYGVRVKGPSPHNILSTWIQCYF